jgi:hypothetical protein
MVACVSSHTAVLAAGEGKKERKRESPSGRSGVEGRERERKGAAWPEERKKPELLLLLVVCV